MIDSLSKHIQTTQPAYDFCVLIPSWNNLPYLQNCIRSIQKNATLAIQIVVMVNEGNDGTIEWLRTQKDVDFVHAKQNIGICYGVNIARSLAKSSYLMYLNDDMYVLPGWDAALKEEIQQLGTKAFMISGTLIEPTDTGNPCVVIRNYGTEIDNFQEEKLLQEYTNLYVKDWFGSMWPPNVVHIDTWDLVGGLSIEYSPGMYSDPDFARKLYEAGVRIFKGKGNSLVYHFGSRTTRRLGKNTGRKQFLGKWKITARTFTQQYLRLGDRIENQDTLTPPTLSFGTRIINTLKYLTNF